ncbi:hypothetical protein JR316_0010249 [Psilocybe cubensis]|uniref:Uncharacterized protein n=2 Tax=Psilocybe cubensis TaxID=181762 RepID=A0ACB8GR02_PSICU|nr:hypothetical protein JR316_0010249 [Psilocybe cubensis]KAH9478014.1 hypothetical protein JR316_0010249 [Psilocybe cubensis]
MISPTWIALLTFASVVSTYATPPTIRRAIPINVRRDNSFGNGNPIVTKSSGSSQPQSGGVHSNTASDEEPFECSVTVTEADAEISWRSTFPNQMQSLAWTGTGNIECSSPMLEMSMSIFAIDPSGTQHVIGSGSCAGCADLPVLTTDYICQQAEQGGECAGEWSVAYEATVEAPPDSEFLSGSGSCVAEGVLLSCEQTAVIGTARPYENANLPPGYVDNVELDPIAIEDIRDFHFKGGARQDNSKGLFFDTITDSDLEAIFERGLLDTSEWTKSNTGNWKRTFPYSGVGVTSGGGAANFIDIFITPIGGTVASMYPSS